MTPETMPKITFQETIFLNGKNWKHTKTQMGEVSAIYKSEDGKEILRIGQKDKISKDLELHKKLVEQGFPVAQILQIGENNGLSFFIETSIGELVFGEIFRKDMEKISRPSDENFRIFLDIILNFAKAQIDSKTEIQDWNGFEKGLYLENMCREFPELAKQIKERFEGIKTKYAKVPFSTMQGDLNCQNIMERGVIDFEFGFSGPVMFDVLGCIDSDTWLPDVSLDNDKAFNWFRFTPEQKSLYLKEIDDLYIANNLPKPSEMFKDFRFLKGLWWSAEMSKKPGLQAFRIALLKTTL